jgi:cell division protein FtsW
MRPDDGSKGMAEGTSKKRRPDYILLIITMILAAIGTIMIYSSSSIIAVQKFGDGYHFLKKQLLFLLLGGIAMLSLAKLPYAYLKKAAYAGIGISAVLLILLFIPGLGVKVGGARRWLGLPGFSFQVAETVKILVIIFLAYYLTRSAMEPREFAKGFLAPILIVSALAALIYKQPDLGTAVLIMAVTLIMLYVAGCRIWHLSTVFLAGLPFVVYLIYQQGYRIKRLGAFLDPWKDPKNTGFQIIQSFLSFGSGGIFGAGIGDGMQKLFYLPEPHTDFILSVIGEEIGFIGIAAVIILFTIFIFRGFVISLQINDSFGSLLGLGLTALIALEVFINVAGVMGLIPTKGMALPFISYGGTSLVMSMAAVGILLNLSMHRKIGGRGAASLQKDE